MQLKEERFYTKNCAATLIGCGVPATSLKYIVSLGQWVNGLLPIYGSAVHVPGMHPHSQYCRSGCLLLVLSRCLAILVTSM